MFDLFSFFKAVDGKPATVEIVSLGIENGNLYESVNREGFFCIANSSSGFIYMGEFEAQEHKDAIFKGFFFKDKTIMKYQERFVYQLIGKETQSSNGSNNS